MPLQLSPPFADLLRSSERPLIGGWVCSSSPVMAEVMAGSGLDWLLIDMEHSPTGISAALGLLHAVSGYPTIPVVRVASDDSVLLKQVLDLGAQNIIVPMVSTAAQAEAVVRATRYPPLGVRGVGSALARSARWNRVENYLADASSHISVFVQIETAEGVANAQAIAATDGIAGVFVGPSDLAASLGLLGQQSHPEVIAAVHRAFASVAAANKPVGVNAFDPAVARAYLKAGATFVAVGADVALVARGAEKLAAEFNVDAQAATRASY